MTRKPYTRPTIAATRRLLSRTCGPAPTKRATRLAIQQMLILSALDLLSRWRREERAGQRGAA